MQEKNGPATPPLTRSRVFFRFKDLILRDMDKLALELTSEHGKILSDSAGSITRGMEVVEFACGIPHLLKGEYSENVGTDIDSWSMRTAIGCKCWYLSIQLSQPWFQCGCLSFR
jgi:malonate-semialdehyde dehydrogenase (acetylating)/methylmalonate-semialdehyde dehydrogenase